MRYNVNQYDKSPCAGLRTASAEGDCPPTCTGLGLAGNACPVMLGSSLLRDGETIVPLVDFGFNPTIVHAPAYLLRHGIAYVGTDRFEKNNNRVVCHNPSLRLYVRNNASTARLLLLNAKMRVLKRVPIYGDRCMAYRYSAVDARLFVIGSELHASYVNMWGDSTCRGHFLARINLQLNSSQPAAFVSPQRLRSVRNGGILVHGKRVTTELSDVAPITELVNMHTGAVSTSYPPLQFSTFMHNSMHLIWVPELAAFLGIGHRHLREGYYANGRVVHNAPFQYGYSYRHVFFTLNETTRRINRFSREFCIAALDHSHTCEGISFIMGAFRRNSKPTTISFTYGINDCESALLTLSMARLHALLEFGPLHAIAKIV